MVGALAGDRVVEHHDVGHAEDRSAAGQPADGTAHDRREAAGEDGSVVDELGSGEPDGLRREVLGEEVSQPEMAERYVDYFPQFIARGIEAGLLDQLMVSIAPVTLGAGRPLFPRRFDLELTDVARNRAFVCATYRVLGPMASTDAVPAS